ncbi:VOC family protein [Thiomicrorhabdus sp.]|uniref:VOC family protein n=1 Tax=Thiomicrorhabdus sp. TaxID=2039724 RepID=UPI0029C78FF5|nr:VOC family protein [Thiomicrorhabdus sp.]
MLKISHIDHLVLTVKSIPKTVEFYHSVMGFEVVTYNKGRIALRFGRQKINLHALGKEIEPKACTPCPGAADLCFFTETEMDTILMHLDRHGVKVELGPVQRTGANGPICSVYIRDPDHNLVEIANDLPPA